MKIKIRLKNNQILESLPFTTKVTWYADKDCDIKDVVLATEEGIIVKRVPINRSVKKGYSFVIEFPEYQEPN